MFQEISAMYWLSILSVVFLNNALNIAYAENYRPGVVVYKPVTTQDGIHTQDEVVIQNKDKYIELMKKYKNKVDILILPEYGITGVSAKMLDKTQLNVVETVIGAPGEVACGNQTGDITAALACAAKENNVYTIVNLIEKSENKYYLTTAGFASDGTVCLRCRKHHLSNGTSLDKASDQKSCSFTANFGNRSVPFTVLFGEDLIYGIPSDLSNANVIVTSSIKNILPLSVGFNLYQGFAISNGVNLLVSGYYEAGPDNYGGSGIYYSNGTSEVAFKPDDQMESKVLIKDIPVIPSAPESKIQVLSTVSGSIPTMSLQYANISGLSDKNRTVEKCWDNGKKCCYFAADLPADKISPYNWIALYNKTTVVEQEVEVLLCALALPSATADAMSFKNVKITSKFDKSKSDRSIPLALGAGFIPLNYAFDRNNNTVSSIKEEKILVFGLMHTLGTGTEPGASTALIVIIVLLCIALVGLIVGFLIWRNRQNKARRGH